MRNDHDASAAPRIPSSASGVLIAVAIWSLAWKGASMWRAARNGSKPWFVTLLVTNTLGILDVIYLVGIGRRRRSRRGDSDAVDTFDASEELGHA